MGGAGGAPSVDPAALQNLAKGGGLPGLPGGMPSLPPGLKLPGLGGGGFPGLPGLPKKK